MALSEPLQLSAVQRTELQQFLRKQNLPASMAQRMRIILMLADGNTYREIQESLNTTAPTISLWKNRFVAEGVVGLGTVRPGQPPKILTPEFRAKVLARTQLAPPDGSTHWSVRKMAAVMGVSRELIRRIWKEADLRPHRLDRYMASNDPEFERKATDIIGLYMNPPQHAAVFCVDEKTASALARIEPPLLAKTDPPSRVTMDGHARSPEETVPDLPAVVPSGPASRRTSARLR